MNRRSATRVKSGKVQKKNNHSETLYAAPVWGFPQIIRQRPGEGYHHLLGTNTIHTFLQLLPDLSVVLEDIAGIVLAPGKDYFGCVSTFGSQWLVEINAWPRDNWQTFSPAGYQQELYWLEKLGVPCEKQNSQYVCKFTEHTARAHQLLATLLHEIGHHHDRLSTRKQQYCGRGEPYAFEYSRKYMDQIFDSYCRTFEL